jgi:hypothetical protein
MPTVLRATVAVALLLVAFFGVPRGPAAKPDTAPPDDVARKVAPVAEVVGQMSVVDRALWAEVWEKCARVVEGDVGVAEPVLTDTKSLRLFTVLSGEIAWHRIGGNAPGKYPELSKRLEEFLAAVVGVDDVPLTDTIRTNYVAAARALAYAGRNGG